MLRDNFLDCESKFREARRSCEEDEFLASNVDVFVHNSVEDGEKETQALECETLWLDCEKVMAMAA